MRSARVHGPVPLYYRVYGDLLQRIDRGEWQPGDQLPAEDQLAREYGVSKLTMRRALAGLVRRGLVERYQGKGTFVTQPAAAKLILGGYYLLMDDIVRSGANPVIRTLSLEKEAAGRIARYVELREQDDVYHLQRLLLADADPLAISISFLPADLYPGLSRADVAESVPLEVVQQRYGIRLALQRSWTRPVMLETQEAALLGTAPGQAAFRSDIVVFGVEGRPVEYRLVLLTGVRCQYYSEISYERSVQRFTLFGLDDAVPEDTYQPHGHFLLSGF